MKSIDPFSPFHLLYIRDLPLMVSPIHQEYDSVDRDNVYQEKWVDYLAFLLKCIQQTIYQLILCNPIERKSLII